MGCYNTMFGLSVFFVQLLRIVVRFPAMTVVAETVFGRGLHPASRFRRMAADAALAHLFGMLVMEILPGHSFRTVAQSTVLYLSRPGVITESAKIDRSVPCRSLAARVMTGRTLFRF